MICGIYKITNKVNSKAYIGQSQDIERRWTKHRRELNNNSHVNKHLQSAYNKYGADSFVWEIEEECEESLLDDREIFYIEKYDSFNNGYNQTIGGSGTRGYKLSEETKQKLSEARKGEKHPMYGKHHSEETRKKISEANKNPSEEIRKRKSEARKGKHLSEEHRRKLIESRKGKHHSKETRKKMSEARKGITLSGEHRRKLSEAKRGEKHPRSRKVLCIETGIIYNTITEASRELNLNQSNISQVCTGKRKTCGGYHFKYVDCN